MLLSRPAVSCQLYFDRYHHWLRRPALTSKTIARVPLPLPAAPPDASRAIMAATAEEEAIIRKRYLTQTVPTAANTMPPFKRLVKK